MGSIAGIARKALCVFVSVECLFTLSNDDLIHTLSMFGLVQQMLTYSIF